MALSRRKAAFQVSPTPAGDMSQVPPSTSRQVIQVSPKSAGNIVIVLPSTSRQVIQVQPKPAANISQVLPSISRQVIQVQPKSAGKKSRVQLESRISGKIQEALPSRSPRRLGNDPNARRLQILPSASSQMPQIETDSPGNILYRYPCPKGPMLKQNKMSQMLPGRSSQVAEEGASPSRQGVQVGPCQLLPSPNGSVLQDNPCPKGLLVQEFQQPGGKLVEIGSKSYFVVGGRSDWKRREEVREVKKFQKNPRNNFK